MEIEKIGHVKTLIFEIERMQDIIRQVESSRIESLLLKDGTTVSYLPRGAVKDAVIENCRSKLEELNTKFEDL